LTCTTTKSDNAVEIVFAKNTKLKATVIIHQVVPATAKEVTLYKINKNGKKIKVATLKPNANGNVCYQIKELATYRIEYK
jgi:5-hydroxyisourate hydrolase-like protein (transthyretin family)